MHKVRNEHRPKCSWYSGVLWWLSDVCTAMRHHELSKKTLWINVLSLRLRTSSKSYLLLHQQKVHQGGADIHFDWKPLRVKAKYAFCATGEERRMTKSCGFIDPAQYHCMSFQNSSPTCPSMKSTPFPEVARLTFCDAGFISGLPIFFRDVIVAN